MRNAARRLAATCVLLLFATLVPASGKHEPSADQVESEGLSQGASTAISLRDGTVKYSQVIQTQYFDIIYPAQSELTARLLASRVDALYEKAAGAFETDTWLHFPIIVSPSTQVFNAYYTSLPYNHIILLDTPNDTASLAVEAETIINTFYHELVHAVTANIHKNSKDNKPNLFGDVWSWQFLLNTKLFFMEGATVSLESADGEGRVNSGLAMSPVIQAKLEGNFPAWRDISGPRDIYPSKTASYIFGGAFNSWLQKEYGMSTYADFWKECSTPHISGFTGIFKEVYGISLDEAWKLFEETVPVPSVESDDLRTVLGEKSRYANLTYRPGLENGIVYTKDQCSVRYLPTDRGSDVTDTELFSCYGNQTQLSFSPNGRYLAVSGYLKETADTYSVRIYDMEKRCFTGAEIPYSRNAVITEDAYGRYYVYCIEAAAGYEFATLYAFEAILSAAEDCPEPLSRSELSLFDELFDTAAIPGGAAILRKTNGIWYLSVAGVDGSLESWRFPDGAVPTGLSSTISSDGSYVLHTAITSRGMNTGSETEPGALARFGEITFSRGNAYLSFQTKAFSGGAHEPAVSRNGTVYSIVRYFETDSLVSFEKGSAAMTAPVLMACEEPVQSDAGNEVLSTEFETKKYKPLSYMTRGVVFPVSGIIMSPFSTSLKEGAGLTYWTQNPHETFSFQLSAGRGIYLLPEYRMEPLEIYGTIYGKNRQASGSTFMWDLNTKLCFTEAYKVQKLDTRLIVGEKIPLADPGENLTFINQIVFIDNTLGKKQSYRNAMADIFSVSWQRDRKKAMNPMAVQSLNFGVHFFYEYDILSSYELETKTGRYKYNESTYASAGLDAGFRLPRLLPLAYDPRLTYNLPLTVSASLFKNPSDFVTLNVSTLLFSSEIQKGLPSVPFYVKRFAVTGGWSFWSGTPSGYRFNSWSIFNTDTLFDEFSTLEKTSAVTGSMYFTVSPDIGNMSSANFNLGVSGKYYLRNDLSDKNYEVSIIGTFKY